MKTIFPTKHHRAFTLIELMVIISIISLLSSVVVTETTKSRVKAEDSHMKQESHQLANAISLFKNDNKGKVPVGNSQRNDRNYSIVYEKDPVDSGSAYRESMQILVDGGYIPEIPTSPSGESYSYYVTEDEGKAMFAAKLNLESSGSSGSNSCEFVDVESYDKNNCDWLYNYSVYDSETDTTSYNVPENWILLTIESGDYQSHCSNYGHPSCSSGDGTAISMCSQPEGTYTFGGQEYVQCPTFISIDGITCQALGDVVCNGSSKSDYCSCI